jgi:putative OPT family oligopeptide transporter
MTTTTVPQLSFRAVLLAVVLATVLAAANTYLGLFAGLTIASAIPAAVVSMAVLRALGGGHILENNIVQTGASAGSSIATGVIFTVPALVMLGYWQDFKYGWVLAIAGLGGLLGVLFSIPLRRSMIIEQNLAFPEGKAAAEVLKAGEGQGSVKVLAGAGLLGGFGKLAAASGLRLIPDSASISAWFGKYVAYIGTNLSPALLGVGYIVGVNIGIVIAAGGVIAWHVAIPVWHAYFRDSDPALAATVAHLDATSAASSAVWSAKIRYLGVGAMLMGGLWTIFAARLAADRHSQRHAGGARADGTDTCAETERDVPMRWMLIGWCCSCCRCWPCTRPSSRSGRSASR